MSRDGAPRKLTDLPPEELARKLQEMTQRALEAEAQLESRKSKRNGHRTKEEPIPTNAAGPGTTRKKDRTVDRDSASESSRPAVAKKKTPSGVTADGSGVLKLLEGYTIPTSKNYAFKVNKQLAPRVYLVTRQDTSQELCMKIEPTQLPDPVRLLKRDLYVLLDAERHPKKFTRHFLRIEGKGRVQGLFNYVIMPAGGYDLNQARSVFLNDGDFSRATAARLSVYSFQAIHDLHSMGYVHRDIRPSKFVFSRGMDMAYLVGFSLAYQFKDDGVPTKSPTALQKQPVTKFRSRGYHKGRDLYRKDDLESWLYLCVNLFARRLLPWHNSFNNTQMFVCKERFFCNDFDDVFKTAPRQLRTIMHHLDKINGQERPDYTFFGTVLLTMREDFHFPLSGPFDLTKNTAQTPPSGDGPHEDDNKGLEVANADERIERTRDEQRTFLGDEETGQAAKKKAKSTQKAGPNVAEPAAKTKENGDYV